MERTATPKPAKGTRKREKARAKRREAKADRLVYLAVDVRDGFRCRVCRAYKGHDIQRHHIRYRSAGGETTTANVVSLCANCHLVGVHGGRIKLAGNADETLTITAAGNGPGAVNGWATWEGAA